MDGWKAPVVRGVKYFLAAAALVLSACGPAPTGAHGKRVIVLGVDGMDPNFLERHWDELPNLARLRDRGGLVRLATTTPPESPVAWATFITGLDPAGHGIFDFVHRDPATLEPVSSMAQTIGRRTSWRSAPTCCRSAERACAPFAPGARSGQILAQHGIPATVIRMPTNYPPEEQAGEALAGMGTPDLEGTFGTFTYYTDDPGETAREVSGGRIVPGERGSRAGRAARRGAAGLLRRDGRPVCVNMVADIDPDASAASFRIGGQQFILRQGEWSPWVRVRFPLMGGIRGVSGMFRFYARQLHPAIRIYRSPLNIDPADPALPISAPPEYAGEMARRIGLFYTQGIEEDTSALRQGALDLPEYLELSHYIASQHRAMLRECLRRFHDGLLFFYFSEVDQDSHMLWGRHEDELLGTYQSVDRAVGDVLDAARGATVIVMSDHGFSSFRRAFNLNAWLRREGFLALRDAPRGTRAIPSRTWIGRARRPMRSV